MKPSVLFFGLLIPLSVLAEDPVPGDEPVFPQQMSAKDLRVACASSALTQVGQKRRRYCTGFISGVEEGVRVLQLQHRTEPSICLPESVSGRDLTEVFLRHAAAEPSRLGQPAASVVIDALANSYPCARP